ncbi:ATP-binding protein [Pseudomonas putida]|uniref:ATP-binding protein n=1 Tax=Pseudomonas putida TaxID=303 RepID=UPI0023657023|nr:ATP-binding protein [Pseudomonas putida]MDD2047802.1 ATP-binding protein [Pseudomonas putida]
MGNAIVSMFLRRLLLTFALAASLASPGVNATPSRLELTAQERDWIAAHPLLRVGVFDKLVPFEYLNGKELRGLSSKYLRMIGLRTGLRFELVTTTTSRSARKDLLINGEIDLLSTRRRAAAIADDVGLAYTTRYNNSSTVLVSRFGDQPIVELGQMAGKTLVILARDEYSAFLRNQAPGVTIIIAENAVDMMVMVQEGQADAAVASEWLLIPYLSRQFQGVLQVSGVIPALHTGVSMAVRDDQALLLSILEKALASITADERKAIFDDWFADMNLDIPPLTTIAEHYDGELWMLLSVVLLLLALVWQSRQQRRRAMQNEQEKAMFLAVMSHEIRSPMNAVLAAVELLEHTPLDEQQRHFTGLANNGATTLLRLVDDVLDISRMDAGQLKLSLEPIDVPGLVQREIDSYQLHADEKGLVLTFSGERAIAPLMLDDLRVAQIVRNLISNAIKFTDAGRVEVQLQLLEGPTATTRQLLMRIVDSGIGLSPQALQSLFRPYARSRNAFKRTGGTGLGLVVCRRLVKLMRGKLTLSSTQGVGTTVEVVLPVELAATQDLPGATEAQQPVTADTSAVSGLRVLVVEDTQANRHVLRAQIEGFGCEVLLAEDAAQGLAVFSQQPVNLVLMDCDLPDQDGYSLAAEFRELEQSLERTYCPIIAISALTGNEHLERCFDAGMDGVLSKPIRLAKLQEVIELWCDLPLVPQGQGLTPQVMELSAVHEELRADLSHLLEAVALGDQTRAVHAAHRLHGAALALSWTDLAAAAATLEQTVRFQTDWRNAETATYLRMLVEQWHALTDIPA